MNHWEIFPGTWKKKKPQNIETCGRFSRTIIILMYMKLLIKNMREEFRVVRIGEVNHARFLCFVNFDEDFRVFRNNRSH